MTCKLSYAQSALRAGTVLKKSTVVKQGTYYLLNNNDSLTPVLVVEGSNIVVDFKKAVVIGNRNPSNPDKFRGVGLLVKGKNITIRNLNMRGYKVALLARDVDGLKIENCDFSYNYRQHLNSTQEKEDLSDWMSYHHNENDEWLRYGAAIYLRGCNNAVISNTTISNGQNALMMMECNNAMIFNNNFSFNSGIGIGMYKSSNNKVLYNVVDFNVRGYSHGVYNRGQDSAGMLLYEQSSNNLFYKNSVTHGGDGFFLWAGQTTMDTGEGGCNDNILLRNNFSYAPTNGVEVTFSRNQILHNRIFECDHGIWGGYSYDSRISDNQFRDNRIAIAIEHGQNDTISHNLFFRDKEAIRLWARRQQPADWIYAQRRDTRSMNYVIASNSFNENEIAFNATLTSGVQFASNVFNSVRQELKVDSTVDGLDSTVNEELIYHLSEEAKFAIPEVKQAKDPFMMHASLVGRKNILMTEWGPYNFQYPLVWNTNPTDTSDTMLFDVSGTKGKWKVISYKGIEQPEVAAGWPNRITAKKLKGDRTDVQLELEYAGAAFVDQFGRKQPANKPYRFSFSKFFQPIDFTISWYPFDSARNPITTNYLEHIKTQRPFKTEAVKKIDYAWWGGIKVGDIQHTRFLTIADGAADIAPGEYELGVTWDDAVRVYVDEKLVVDEWNPAKYKFDESPNRKVQVRLGGHHRFRVEHVELGGFATLSVKLQPKSSAGK